MLTDFVVDGWATNLGRQRHRCRRWLILALAWMRQVAKLTHSHSEQIPSEFREAGLLPSSAGAPVKVDTLTNPHPGPLLPPPLSPLPNRPHPRPPLAPLVPSPCPQMSCQCSATGTRTRVARVRAEYPNQLDYSGLIASWCSTPTLFIRAPALSNVYISLMTSWWPSVR